LISGKRDEGVGVSLPAIYATPPFSSDDIAAGSPNESSNRQSGLPIVAEEALA